MAFSSHNGDDQAAQNASARRALRWFIFAVLALIAFNIFLFATLLMPSATEKDDEQSQPGDTNKVEELAR